jgi:hypothetical protein
MNFFDRISHIDKILESEPSEVIFNEDILPLLQEESSKRYFYERLSDPNWINILRTSGMFLNPPEAIEDSINKTIAYPPWPQSNYLVRVAKIAPDEVCSLAITISKATNNILIHQDLAEAASYFPSELMALWVEVEINWVNNQKTLGFLLPEKLGEVLGKLINGKQEETALKLAESLFAIYKLEDRLGKGGDETALPREPKSRLDLWQYEKLMKMYFPGLIQIAGENALCIMYELVDSTLSSRVIEGNPDDRSWMWRPAIEDHSQNSPLGLIDIIISSFRDALELLCRNNKSLIHKQVTDLENKPFYIYHRIALHIVRVFSNEVPDMATERLTSRDMFDQLAYRHEYSLLAKDYFGKMSKKDQELIFGWIRQGIEEQKVKISFENMVNRAPTQEEVSDYIDTWRRDKLALFSNSLTPEWERIYQELVAKYGQASHPDFVSYTTSMWMGPTTPKRAEELRPMTIEEIIDFISSWEPEKKFQSPSHEGLGRELASLIASDPERFVLKAHLFQGLDSTYIYSFFSGLRDAINHKRIFTWEPTLELCKWALGQPQDIPGWSWARKTIADLLSKGLDKGDSEIPFTLREIVWEVLSTLIVDPDPTPESEDKYGGTNMDPATLSINTVRGEAMHAMIRYALWIRRYLETLADKETRISRGFKEMPEVEEALDYHLDIEQEPSLAIRSVYGQWFPWLALVDEKWSRISATKIFSDEGQQDGRYFNAAWDTYVVYCEPYNSVFETLKDEYRKAIERIGLPSTVKKPLKEPEACLAEHLITFYWRKIVNINEPDQLIERFYQKASDVLAAHTLEFVGSCLQNTEGDVPQPILERFMEFWIWRLGEIKKNPSSHGKELAAFSRWFISSKFDDAWSLGQLIAVLRLGKIESEHIVVERLADLTTKMLAESIKCLSLIIDKSELAGIYMWGEKAKLILSAALNSSDSKVCEEAINIINNLGIRGYLGFRELLKK